MSERIRGSYDYALYKSTYTLLYDVYIHSLSRCPVLKKKPIFIF